MNDLLGGLIGTRFGSGFNQADLAQAQAGQLIRCNQQAMHYQQELMNRQMYALRNTDPMIPEPSGTMKSVLEEMIERINILQERVDHLEGERIQPEKVLVETQSKPENLKQRIASYRRKRLRD